jgi:hypothetical protein
VRRNLLLESVHVDKHLGEPSSGIRTSRHRSDVNRLK